MSAPRWAHLADRALGGTGDDGDDGDAYDVHAPATGEHLARVPRARPVDVAAAADRARAAQPTWAARPVAERARLLLRFHDLLLARREEAIAVVCGEAGKVRRDAAEELLDVLNVARYYARTGRRTLAPRRRRGVLPVATRVMEHRHPVGLVGLLVPWNYPLVLGIGDALPALLAGNAVLIKPDPRTPLAALWAATLLDEAGLDPALVQVAVGDGAELGTHVIAAADHVLFTGSTAVGRLVAREAGERLVPCALELGGKNAMLVLDDADLDRVAEGAMSACFASAGQLCMSMERIYVDAARIDRLAELLAARVGELRLGTGDADVGSLIDPARLAAVQAHVADAVEQGAEVVAGGHPAPEAGPCFHQPTVLRGVTPRMRLHDEETFGPVVSLHPYTSEAAAIAAANATPLGLHASVWSARAARARRVATQLRVGSVSINDGYAAAWGSTDSPIGGTGDSGFGRRHGAEGLLAYTRAQTVATQHLLPLAAHPRIGAERWERLLVRALGLLRRSGLRR